MATDGADSLCVDRFLRWAADQDWAWSPKQTHNAISQWPDDVALRTSETVARRSERFVLDGATVIRGPFRGISGAHVLEATAFWLQTMVALTAGDTVEVQGCF